ncbi:MAG: tyrosine-type recombinase/integrase [Desulfobulbaceae bacterium]|nr:tyrosine-type recombinase/integrase [Desulfobulbaceae bacterium]
MALESVFVRPRTIAKLRSGPLGELLDGYADWLLESGFRRSTIRRHLTNVSYLNRYFASQNITCPQVISSKDLNGFLEDYPLRARFRGSLDKHLRCVNWSINRFVYYLKHLKLYSSSEQSPLFQSLLDFYLKWMRDYKHATPGTLGIRAHSLKIFFKWLGPQATTEGMSELTHESVENFFLSYADKSGRAARRSMQAALRTFFRFCLHQGFVQQPLDCAVPTLRTYKLAVIPRGLTDVEALNVLSSINRSSNAGRRDYAMLLVLYTYGVRGGQVRALCLQDIDWANDQIYFKALKQGKNCLLPLSAEVGQSLLDYIQNARPPSSYQEVFLTTRAPYHPLPGSNDLSAIVRRHICNAGIESHAKGAHVFRHGLATSMLQRGHSLKEIADVLGHRHLRTTFIYSKVDFNTLRKVGLAWPGEVE